LRYAGVARILTPRWRDALLLSAGLLGVVAIFLPVTEFIGPISPAGYFRATLSDPSRQEFHDPLLWLAMPVLLPIPIAVLQLYRVFKGARAGPVTIFALTLVAALAGLFLLLLVDEVWKDVWRRAGGALIAVALVIPTTGNLGLLYRNLSRRLPLTVTTEVLMLGTYVSSMVFWLWQLLAGPYTAPKLIAWTCFVYLLTIVIRLRESRPIRTSGSS
jgi:hypothetical protein